MGTTENESAFSTTAATNSTADAGINWAEGQDPATVNNSARGMMAARAKARLDQGGSLAAGGTANALTVTTNQILSSGHVAAGQRLLIRATADNTSATVTFAPDGLTAANIKRADGSALAIGSIKSGMYLDLVYNSGSSEWRCANIPPLSVISGGGTSVGMVLLTSGSASGATLNIVLTSYTAYRGIKIFLSGFIPSTDAVALQMRFSTDGGSNYDASGYNYITNAWDDTGTNNLASSGSTTSILITWASAIGNGANEGYSGEITLLAQTSTALWSRVHHSGYYISATATPAGNYVMGGGARETAQDTDAVQFLFSLGNITSGSYAVYGLV